MDEEETKSIISAVRKAEEQGNMIKQEQNITNVLDLFDFFVKNHHLSDEEDTKELRKAIVELVNSRQDVNLVATGMGEALNTGFKTVEKLVTGIKNSMEITKELDKIKDKCNELFVIIETQNEKINNQNEKITKLETHVTNLISENQTIRKIYDKLSEENETNKKLIIIHDLSILYCHYKANDIIKQETQETSWNKFCTMIANEQGKLDDNEINEKQFINNTKINIINKHLGLDLLKIIEVNKKRSESFHNDIRSVSNQIKFLQKASSELSTFPSDLVIYEEVINEMLSQLNNITTSFKRIV